MMLRVVRVEQGGFVPRHPGAGAHLGQAGQARADLPPPAAGGGTADLRIVGRPRGRADERELSPYDVGQPGQQVEPEPPGP